LHDFSAEITMRGLVVALATLVLLCLAACHSSDEVAPPASPVDDDPRSDDIEGALRINELKALGSHDTSKPAFEGALEIVNVSDAPVQLGSYSVRIGYVDNSWQLPQVTLAPGALYVARRLNPLHPATAGFLSQPAASVAVVDRLGREIDRMEIPASVAGGVLARYPNMQGPAYVYPLDRASLGEMNPDIGFIRNKAGGTEFLQRDSSPNAIVTYGGYHWILGGWSNFGGDDWHSYTDVWKSSDGVRWSLVNQAPPYTHYSSFLEWRDRIWVIGPSSFSSEDGIDWWPELIDAPVLNRTIVFRGSLLSISGATVVTTDDGRQWTTLTETAPWGNDRVQPTVLVYQDKIWVMGGTGGTSDAEVFFNDVWVSDDGATWNLVNAYSDWTPRLWTSGVVLDDKIFVINGLSQIEWPDDWGNTAEIWFTEDGIDWFPLESELKWTPRHASFTTIDEKEGVLLLGGYGGGNVLERSYNDVWTINVKVFFSKPEGDLADLRTWGKRKDGSGESPTSFDAPDQLFVLRNRSSFEIDESWSVRGAGSRIFVGDGQRTHSVELHIDNGAPAQQPLYLLSNSTTVVSGCSPTVYFQHPEAALIRGSEPCPGGQ
jgi:hypothetical protein